MPSIVRCGSCPPRNRFRPEILNGILWFRGTRVPFQNLLDYLENGKTLDAFLAQSPTVTREMTIATMEEAKDSLFARIA